MEAGKQIRTFRHAGKKTTRPRKQLQCREAQQQELQTSPERRQAAPFIINIPIQIQCQEDKGDIRISANGGHH